MSAPEPLVPAPRDQGRRGLTAALADSLGATRGQVSTAIVSVLLAGTLALGLPPVLRNRYAVSDAPNALRSAVPNAAAAPVSSPPTPDDAKPVLNPFVDLRSDPGSPTVAAPATETVPPGPKAPDRAALPLGSARVFARVGPPGAPDGIAVGPDGTVYVATNNGSAQGEGGPSQILRFGTSGAEREPWSVTGQPADHRLGLTGLAIDGQGGLLALDAATGRVLRFALSSGRQTTYAQLFDLPSCQLVVLAVNGCEPGVGDDPPLPRGLAVDNAGAVYVTDAAQGTIWKIPVGGGTPVAFFGDAAFASPDGLDGIALASDGTLFVASPRATEPPSTDHGAIYRLRVADGAPEGLTRAARFDAGQGPSGLALLDNGSMAVTLRDAAAVVLLGPAGVEERRVKGAAGEIPFDTPAGAAFLERTLLVSNRAPTTAAGWAIFAVGIR